MFGCHGHYDTGKGRSRNVAWRRGEFAELPKAAAKGASRLPRKHDVDETEPDAKLSISARVGSLQRTRSCGQDDRRYGGRVKDEAAYEDRREGWEATDQSFFDRWHDSKPDDRSEIIPQPHQKKGAEFNFFGMIMAFHTQKENTGTLALEQEVEYVKAETTEQARLRKAEMDEDRADEGGEETIMKVLTPAGGSEAIGVNRGIRVIQVGHYLGQPVFADVPVTTSLYRTHPQQRRFTPGLRDTSLARRIPNVLRFDKGITKKDVEPCDSTGYVHAPYPGGEHRLTKGHDAGFHTLVKRFALHDAFFIYNAERSVACPSGKEPQSSPRVAYLQSGLEVGKTVTTLFNIVNGKSKKGMKLRATLIVATSAQVPQFHEVFSSHGRKYHCVGLSEHYSGHRL
ncbi:hypothetical protein LTR17_025910 [Elasticomyces elasticus]|nr:hypothetical protein LTR17_025910 [Elasticomyces elasticus]